VKALRHFASDRVMYCICHVLKWFACILILKQQENETCISAQVKDQMERRDST